MSERSAFTSEYIYNPNDYKILRERANKWGNSKWLCFAPEARWGDNDMPILSGKVGCLAPAHEFIELCNFLRGVKTECPITFIIIPEWFDEKGLQAVKVVKTPEGRTDVFHLTYSDGDPDHSKYSYEMPGKEYDDYGNSTTEPLKEGIFEFPYKVYVLKNP